MDVSVSIVVLIAYSLCYVAFLLWYGGRGKPLAPGEADSLLERARLHARAANVPVAPDLLEALRAVSREDDGREFVMVNLIKYRPKAVYPSGYSYNDDPHAADARYNRAVVPLLLKRACVPVFLGRSAGRFLAANGADEWERVALVRYRSRRDLLKMCVELARSRADIHKWASIEKTHVFPVRCLFSLVLIRLIAGGLFAVFGVLVYLIAR